MIVTRNNWLLGHMIFWLFVLIFTMSIPEMRQNANCWHVAVPFGLPKLAIFLALSPLLLQSFIWILQRKYDQLPEASIKYQFASHYIVGYCGIAIVSLLANQSPLYANCF